MYRTAFAAVRHWTEQYGVRRPLANSKACPQFAHSMASSTPRRFRSHRSESRSDKSCLHTDPERRSDGSAAEAGSLVGEMPEPGGEGVDGISRWAKPSPRHRAFDG
jgi:hypothetical protein